MQQDQLGRPIRDLRISLTDRCNLRCTYCMPKTIFGPDYVFLKKDQWLRFSELDALVACFVRLGVRKIRLTGGEPLLRPGLTKYIEGLQQFSEIEDIALTTNGLRLAERIPELCDAGLSRVTVSLDALDAQLNGEINGRGISSKPVLAGIDAALNAGLPVKVNMVVERGVNEHQILPMARYFKDLGVCLRFIEFMDVGNHNGWNLERVVSGQQILECLQAVFELKPVDTSSNLAVAKRYAYADGSAEVGLITSVTQPFCGGCTRARISADGKLYTCLFANTGMDLKPLVRVDDFDAERLYGQLAKIWGQRKDQYSQLRSQQTSSTKKVEMSYIGG